MVHLSAEEKVRHLNTEEEVAPLSAEVGDADSEDSGLGPELSAGNRENAKCARTGPSVTCAFS